MQDEQTRVPTELTGFSWAALLWGGIWAISYRVWIGLWAFVPCLGLIMNVVLGVKGREWAWRRGAIEDVEGFNRAQRSWVIVGVALLVVSVPVWTGVGSALAIYGVRKYLINARSQEVPVMFASMTRAVASCQKTRGSLPLTSGWVPATAPAAAKYQSAPADWAAEPAFACSGFSWSDPQYFRYRWVKDAADSGHFEAESDFDGDGSAEVVLAQPVHCDSLRCSAGLLSNRSPR